MKLEWKHVSMWLRVSPGTTFHQTPDVKEVACGSFKDRSPPDIKASGHVVRSLEAALWAFHHTSDFKEGCLRVGRNTEIVWFCSISPPSPPHFHTSIPPTIFCLPLITIHTSHHTFHHPSPSPSHLLSQHFFPLLSPLLSPCTITLQ